MAESPESADNLVLEVFDDSKDRIPYRPKLAKAIGWIPSAILLQQIYYRWKNNSFKPFYKFKEPCENKLYRADDSWCEELGFTRGGFDTALRRIAVKKTKGMTMEDAIRKAMAGPVPKPVIYWITAGRIPYYTIHKPAFLALLRMAYLRGKLDSSDSKSGKPALGKAGNQLYQKPDSSDTITETTTDQPETTTDIPAHAENPPSQPGLSVTVIVPEAPLDDERRAELVEALEALPVPKETSQERLTRLRETHGSDPVEAIALAAERGAADGNSFTIPAEAGGADSFSDGPVEAFCAFVGLPVDSLPDKKRGQWASELSKLADVWQVNALVLTDCIEAMPDSEFHFKSYSSPYQDSFKNDVGVLIGRYKGCEPLVERKKTRAPPAPRTAADYEEGDEVL